MRPVKMKYCFKSGKEALVASYSRNSLYSYSFLAIIPFFGFLLLFLELFSRLANGYIDRRVEKRMFISELKLKTIRNQLEPHFLFNTMNTIGYLILKEDPEKAYDYLQHLSGLFRDILHKSDEVNVKLEEELNLVENYLTLEKIRFEDHFQYSITYSDNVDMEFEIPRMLIQLHAENAIKHGVMQAKDKGTIGIRISNDGHNHTITIEDNGPGREASSRRKGFYSGAGMGLSRQLINLYQEITSRRVQQTVVDLYDEEGIAAGTRVVIIIDNPGKDNPTRKFHIFRFY